MRRPANLVRGATVAVGIVYSGVLAAAGFEFDTTAKLLLGLLPTFATVLLVAWDVFAWKWPLLQKATGRPWISGLWAVELQPTAESHIPEGGDRGPIQAYAVITQSFWSVHVEQYTAESKSSSKSFFWQRSGAGFDGLAFTYQNDPKPEVSTRSGIHYGTCTFHLVGLRPARCTGYYFTDRYTKGGMELALVDRRTDVGSFSDAAARHDAVSRRRERDQETPQTAASKPG